VADECKHVNMSNIFGKKRTGAPSGVFGKKGVRPPHRGMGRKGGATGGPRMLGPGLRPPGRPGFTAGPARRFPM
jgi:hypothetical protein